MIQWNDGLSVGVKALDDDHKKLLEVINKLSTCIEQNEDMLVFDEIFTDLEEYVHKHFHTEELLLKKCNYKLFANTSKRIAWKFF